MPKEVKPVVEEEVAETRVDEFGLSVFRAMGHAGRLPDTLVSCYNEFKRRKDSIVPGRLSPEAFATVSILAEMVEKGNG